MICQKIPESWKSVVNWGWGHSALPPPPPPSPQQHSLHWSSWHFFAITMLSDLFSTIRRTCLITASRTRYAITYVTVTEHFAIIELVSVVITSVYWIMKAAPRGKERGDANIHLEAEELRLFLAAVWSHALIRQRLLTENMPHQQN